MGSKMKRNDSKTANSNIGFFVTMVVMLALGIATPPLATIYDEVLGQKVSDFIIKSREDLLTPLLGGDSELIVRLKRSVREEAVETSTFVPCNEYNLGQFLSEENNVGTHIFCFKDDVIDVYKNSKKTKPLNFHITDSPFELITYDIIQKSLRIAPHIKSNTQPYAFFTINGKKIAIEDQFKVETMKKIFNHGMLVLVEGGNFIWPGIKIGFKRKIDLETGYPSKGKTTIEMETLSMKPLVLSVPGFILEDECDHIIDVSGKHMEYSSVSLMDHDKGRPASDFRTSQSYFLEAEDEKLHALEARTASITRVSKTHQEHTQVLRYGYMQKYDQHLDWFDAALYKNDKLTQEMIQYGKKNRLATVFWYLSDVEKGGHTIFPRFNGAPQPRVFNDCTKGLKVKPEKGKVIIFYSLLADGTGDHYSLHGACPVEEGIKWAANKWVWNDKMQFVS